MSEQSKNSVNSLQVSWESELHHTRFDLLNSSLNVVPVVRNVTFKTGTTRMKMVGDMVSQLPGN